MGKHRAIIVLGIAVVIALVSSGFIYNWIQNKMRVKQTPVVETQPISVAVQALPWGTVLTPEMVKPATYLKSSLPPGCFSDPASLQGRVLISPVTALEPILESRLAPQNIKTGGVAAVVKPKKRAIAVKVDKVIGVSGFISPGNRVDVLVTVSPDRNAPPRTKTVLENVLVLAVGPEVDRKGKEEKATTGVDVITLEVTPEEAEKLALSASEGKLQMALRNHNDTEAVLTPGSTLPILLASYSSKQAVPERKVRKGGSRKAVEKSPPSSVQKVEVIEKKVEVQNAVLEKTAPPKPAPFVVELIKGNNRSLINLERGE